MHAFLVLELNLYERDLIVTRIVVIKLLTLYFSKLHPCENCDKANLVEDVVLFHLRIKGTI